MSYHWSHLDLQRVKRCKRNYSLQAGARCSGARCKWYPVHWRIQGGAPGTRAPPLGSKFFHFHAVFGKKLKNNSIFGSWPPPLGKILDPPLQCILPVQVSIPPQMNSLLLQQLHSPPFWLVDVDVNLLYTRNGYLASHFQSPLTASSQHNFPIQVQVSDSGQFFTN